MHYSFLEKFGASVLIVMWMLWGGNQIGNMLVHAEPSPLRGSLADNAGEQTAATAEAEPEKPFPELLAAATAEAGEKVFKKCVACHTAEKAGKNKVGPNLWDTVGKDIASHEGFSYSSALQGLEGNWDYQKLDEFLTKPAAFVRGTKMTFAGLKKAADRAAVIAYLRSLSEQPKPLP